MTRPQGNAFLDFRVIRAWKWVEAKCPVEEFRPPHLSCNPGLLVVAAVYRRIRAMDAVADSGSHVQSCDEHADHSGYGCDDGPFAMRRMHEIGRPVGSKPFDVRLTLSRAGFGCT